LPRLPLKNNGDISDRLINDLPQPKAKPILYWHPGIKGLGVAISAKKGTRTWIVQRDISGRTRRVTLGPVGSLAPEQILRRAYVLMDDMRQGKDPRNRSPQANTVGRLLDRMLKAKEGTRRSSTLRNYRWLITKYTEDWLNRPLVGISPDEIMRRHRKITTQAGPVSADNWANTFRTLWNFAIDLEAVDGRNPVDILKRQRLLNGKPVRDRIVPLDRIPEFLAKTDEIQNIVQRAFIRFLLFTALRRSEAAALMWSDVENDCIRIPADRNKSGRDFVLPLSSSALAALATLPKGYWVFPADSKSGHLEDPRKALANTGFNVSCHDLRRTWATCAAFILTDAVRRRLLNHAPATVTERHYTVFNDAELLRKYVEAVDQHLMGEQLADTASSLIL
jgi:integrase